VKRQLLGLLLGILAAGSAHGEELVVDLYLITADGRGKASGTLTLADSPYGLLFTPRLSDLGPGVHGFHVHQNPNCGPGTEDTKRVAGLAAGGHYDPEHTGRHEGPYGHGHLGERRQLCRPAAKARRWRGAHSLWGCRVARQESRKENLPCR
jgi:superoxide dismutase, Cu-Zn family